MSGLPRSWLDVEIGSIADVVAGGTPKAKEESYFSIAGEGIAWLTPADLSGYKYKEISHGKRDISQLGLDNSSAKLMPAGSLLFSSRAPIGYVAIAANEISTNQGFKSFVFTQHIDSSYAYYYLKSIRGLAESRGTGTTFKELSGAMAKKLPFRLAPLNEQIRIANKLDSILTKVDKAQARLDKIPAILKRFRQSVLAAATSGELTKEWREENAPIKHSEVTGKYALDWSIVEESALPESWQWVPLGNYAKCNRGKFSIRPRNDPSCFDGDYPFIQIGDLPRQGGFIYSHKQTLNEKGYSVSREFDAGTVVLAIVGATIANTGITTYPVCFPDSLVGINSASETTNKYLDYHLRAIKEDIRQASYAGGGQPNIKLTMVNPLPLPLPSEAEIVEIVAKVELLMARANKVEKQYFDAKARLDRLTQSILAKAFRGELVPQDPNDEPAEKLLERIVAEKEQSKPKKTTRKRTTKAKMAEKE